MGKAYIVTAGRWEDGWELHVDGVGVTQSSTWADAERMALDYLATELGGEPQDYTVELRTAPPSAEAVQSAAAVEDAHRRGWMTPDLTAEAVDEAIQEGDELWAFKLVVQARDEVATMIRTGDDASAAWLFRSRPISDERGIFISAHDLSTA